MALLDQDMVAKLISLAKDKTIYDNEDEDEDVVIDDFAGGNVDDAYNIGQSDGEIYLARRILGSMGIDWNE